MLLQPYTMCIVRRRVQAWEPGCSGSSLTSATQQQCDLGASDLTSGPSFPHLSNRGTSNTSVMGLM